MSNIYLENIRLNEEEFRQKKTLLESKPTRIMVTLTNKCNFRCKMCRWSIRKSDLTLQEEYIGQIIRLFPYLDYIAWQGGEVFLVDYFKDVFKEIMRHPNIAQEITTNASLINEEWAELISMSNIRLIVSVDSLDKETFAYIRKGGRLDDVIRNISLISKAKEKNNKTKSDYGINIIVMKANYRELEAFVDFALQYKFNFLNFMYLVDTLALDEHIFEPIDNEAVKYLRESMPKIIDRATSLGIRVSYEFEPLLDGPYASSKRGEKTNCLSPGNNGNYFCRLPWMRLFINGAEEGARVYPECICKMSVGELSKSTLDEIWNDEGMQLYRKKILSHEYHSWCTERCVKGLVNKEFLQNR